MCGYTHATSSAPWKCASCWAFPAP
ncbi:hypothetical protein [Pseudomonas sp. IPO3778]